MPGVADDDDDTDEYMPEKDIGRFIHLLQVLLFLIFAGLLELV